MACLPPMTLGQKKEKPDGTARAAARKPRRITPAYLENAGLYYLGRYASSVANFRRVLMSKVRRSARTHETNVEEAEKWIDDLIGRYQRANLLDDRRYAETRVTQLHRRGMAIRRIQAKLYEKGVPSDVIAAALQTLREGAARPDLAGAVAYARRRRLGPYRAAELRDEQFERDLATLGRAGFSYAIAREVLEADSPAALEILLAQDGMPQDDMSQDGG